MAKRKILTGRYGLTDYEIDHGHFIGALELDLSLVFWSLFGVWPWPELSG